MSATTAKFSDTDERRALRSHAKRECSVMREILVFSKSGMEFEAGAAGVVITCEKHGFKLDSKYASILPGELVFKSPTLGGAYRMAVRVDGGHVTHVCRPMGPTGQNVSLPSSGTAQVKGEAADAVLGARAKAKAKAKAAKATKKATSDAKADVVAEVIADAPAPAPALDRMGNLREILAMFPDATLAEAMACLDA